MFIGLALFTFMMVSAIAQPSAKVIAVINHAEWCPTCKKHGERAKAAFMENNKDGAIQFVINDVTNDETKQASAKQLKELGLHEAMANNNATGVAYFFDADNKKLIKQISVASSNEELADAMAYVTKKQNH